MTVKLYLTNFTNYTINEHTFTFGILPVKCYCKWSIIATILEES